MSTYSVPVFHATPSSAAQSILARGFLPKPGGWNIYGRGNYFWVDAEDAVEYSNHKFGERGVVLTATFDFEEDELVVFDHDVSNYKRTLSNNDFARSMIDAGIKYMLIGNEFMRQSTGFSDGRPFGDAFLQFVDVSAHFSLTDHLDDIPNVLSGSVRDYIDQETLDRRAYENLL